MAARAPLAALSMAPRRRRRRRAVLVATAAGLVLMLLAAIERRPRLVWNASASMPVGLYALVPSQALARGDLVLAQLPDRLSRFAAARHYLPAGLPLIKRIAALPGDWACGADAGQLVFGAGLEAVARLRQDRRGRPLPVWTACRRLRDDEFLLLGTADPASFDSRYFGPLPRAAVTGRLLPLWLR